MRFISIIILVFICFRLQSQIVINEIQTQPAGSTTASNPQNLVDCTPTPGAEYVELYNTDPCTPLDISCYILANNIAGTSAAAHGGFRFPAGTIVPPLGFVSVGGANSGATFNLNALCGTANLNINPAGRWYLPNGDGYMMLYDASGNVVDAIYWTLNSGEASKWGTDTDINTNPTRIPAGTASCPLVSSLSGPANLGIGLAEYIGQAPGSGFSSSRQTDGSATWVRNVAGTINSCNGACNVSSTFSLTSTKTNPTCGSSNGSATVTPNPAGSYTFTWTSPAVSTTNTASGLPAGTYTVTVGQGGCTTTTVITLTNSGSPTITATQTIAASCGTANGSATVTATAGSTFTWNPIGGNSSTANGLSAGSYTVIAGISGCTTTSVITIPSLSGPTVTSVQTLTTICGLATGAATVNTTPTSTSYTWSSGVSSTTNTASNLAAGNYTVTAGTAGCTTSTVITIGSGSAPTISSVQTLTTACGLATGSATVNTTPASMSYTWSSGVTSTTNTASNLAAGNYTVTAGTAGCTTSTVITIGSGASPTISSVQTLTTTCGLATGAATINTTPASTSYTWSSGVTSTTNTASNLAAGNYTVTAGTAGCTTSTIITIGSGGAPTISSVQTLTTACGLATGSATVNTTPASTSYTWSSGATSTTNTASNLAAGNYTVTAGTGGCNTSTVITIGSGGAPTISSVQTLTTACGLATGSATVNTTPASISYTWSSGVSSTTNTASNLAAGNYTVTAGNTGCTTSTIITIGSGAAPTISSVQTLTTACGLATGSATVNTTPVSTSYTWSSGVSSTTNTASNLAAGNYTVTAGTAGCTTSTVISIVSVGQPTISATQTTGENCNLSDGTANFSFSPSSSSIVWSSGIASTTNTANGLAAGNYTVTLTNGACTTSTVITINPIINTFTISPNVTIQQGSSTQINSSAGTSYTWTPITNLSCTNCSNPIVNPDQTTTYCVSSFDGTCTYTNCVTITVEIPCVVNKNYSAPNAFSPNGDGNNDEFCIKGLSNCIISFEISIYNRWGEIVYSSTEADFCWDGKYQGVVLDPAVFVFYLKARYLDNTELIKKGNVTLLH
jgi:gliding motility-associated-like protein